MKPRTIVYGLGKRFQQYFYEIHDTYNVVGYCDANPDKVTMFRNGINKEELVERQNEYEQILITFVHWKWRMSIVIELVNYYKIDVAKIVFFDVPSNTSVLRESKDSIYHPEMIFWGQNNEDVVIYLLGHQLNLDFGNLTYFESGLQNLRVGSVTYGLYRLGARGVVTVIPYDALYDEIKIYRSEDTVINVHEDILEALKDYEGIDIIALHDETSLKKMLEEDCLFKYKPLIIIMDNIMQDIIYYIRAHGYVWHSTLSAASAVFCRSDIYLSQNIWINRGQ